jgi:hypothetical protein
MHSGQAGDHDRNGSEIQRIGHFHKLAGKVM